MHVVILAGGTGSRLWPVSTDSNPKPFVSLNNDLSLLQNTLTRINKIAKVESIIISTNVKYADKVLKQCLQISLSKPFEIIAEEESQDTTVAIAVATFYIKKKFGAASNALIIPCDHVIRKELAFFKAIEQSLGSVHKNKITLFGVKPDYPERNYGYIKHQNGKVLNFIEKPSIDRAREFVEYGQYLWNSGMLCSKVEILLSEIDKYNTDLVSEIETSLKQAKAMCVQGRYITLIGNTTNSKCESIDYSTLQKSNNITVIPCDIGWSDVGNWNLVSKMLPSDQNGNNINGQAVLHDTSNCYIASQNKKIVTVGVSNLAIIEHEGNILIVNKNDASSVKTAYQKFIK